MKRMTHNWSHIFWHSVHFNSHPHEEDDPTDPEPLNYTGISTHIITKRMTVKLGEINMSGSFQLTSSRRGWLKQLSHSAETHYFNSHPHEEDDLKAKRLSLCQLISTHILTKRMTFSGISLLIWLRTFQLTSSRRGWPERTWTYVYGG